MKQYLDQAISFLYPELSDLWQANTSKHPKYLLNISFDVTADAPFAIGETWFRDVSEALPTLKRAIEENLGKGFDHDNLVTTDGKISLHQTDRGIEVHFRDAKTLSLFNASMKDIIEAQAKIGEPPSLAAVNLIDDAKFNY